MMKFFVTEVKPQTEQNDGVRHPDFDDTVITDITEFYRRFAADPDFKVRMLPPSYDIDSVDLTDGLLESDEPEFGSQDLEYYDQLQRDKTKNDELNDEN